MLARPSRRCIIALVLAFASGVGACTQGAPDSPGRQVRIAIAPLQLAGVSNACYSIAVTSAFGPVWSRSSICANDYGDGQGSVSYVGTCDASGDGVNTVALTLDSLYSSEDTTSPLAAGEWQNPCGAPSSPTYDGNPPCELRVQCLENADVAVTFNLTVMRSAEQGFFDVAVKFEDIFCSAKFDCTDSAGQPLQLVFDPATGLRVPTSVIGFACTGGVGADTHLYFSDVVLRCQGLPPVSLSLATHTGNMFSVTAAPPPPLLQVGVFRGVEALTDPEGVSLGKLYNNLALGFDLTSGAASDCRLELTATATDGPLIDCTTPDATTYPLVRWAVDVTDLAGKRFVCGHHPLDAIPGRDVYTTYTGMVAPETFASTTAESPAEPGTVSATSCDQIFEGATGGNAKVVAANGPVEVIAGSDKFADENGDVVTGNVIMRVATDGFGGNFAVAGGGVLAPTAMADISFTDDRGRPINVARGSAVTLLMPVPAGAAVAPGDSVLIYSFDQTSGRWTAESSGTVVTRDGGLAVSGEVTHFTWYATDTGQVGFTGALSVPRAYHTATLLLSGDVLVAGGYASNYDATDSAEVYEPSLGTFAVTGPLNDPRFIHTATLLPSGEVLIAGGAGMHGAPLTSAELYDPATGTFTLTGDLAEPRFRATATLLHTGEVLILGGEGPDGSPLATAELYDPSSGTFRATGSLAVPRTYHTATLLPSGKVLVVGGVSRAPNLSVAEAEVYDPDSGQFSSAGNLTTGRYLHSATLLASGQVLVATGYTFDNPTFRQLSIAEIFEATNGTFAATGSMSMARVYHTATLLPSGQVLVLGGDDGAGQQVGPSEVFTPELGTFTSASALLVPREAHTATLLHTGEVLVVGGSAAGDAQGVRILASAELYGVTCDACDDGDPCTVDACSVGSGCTHVPLCDDHVFCNGQETCDPMLGCQAGLPPEIDDGIACTEDACDETQGVVHVPTDTYCDDAYDCNGQEVCDAQVGCVPGPLPDDDGDGVGNCEDVCPGVWDDVADADADGVVNCLDECPFDHEKSSPGPCGCGVQGDADEDRDGVPDCTDECPDDPLKTAPSICGCGKVDDATDSDADGIPDCVDECPADPHKSAPGACGCGVLTACDGSEPVGFGRLKTMVHGDTGYVSAQAGGTHTVALRGDGTVVAWGGDGDGQTNVPAGLTDVVEIAAGGAHTVALSEDGTVVAWGRDDQGQATVPAGLTGVVGVAAGGAHTLALASDGTVVAWGADDEGQSDVPDGLADVVAIAAGTSHSMALTRDGAVVAWGRGNNFAAVPEGLSGVVAIAAGALHSLALKADGTVVAWGWNDFGQATVPPGLSDVVAIAGGYAHSVALRRDGTLVAWGWNASGQCAIPAGLDHVVGISAGMWHTVALKADGTVAGWGDDANGQATAPTGPVNVTGVAVGTNHIVGLRGDGSLAVWGSNLAFGGRSLDYGQTTLPSGLGVVVGISAGLYDTVAVRADGTVAVMGQLSQLTAIPSGLSSVVAVAAGENHTLALAADGTVVAWGDNHYGQASVPAGLGDVARISAGELHSVALRHDGTVVAWGSDGAGQSSLPSGLSDVIEVAAGGSHTMALERDGTVVAWGRDTWGQATVPSGLSAVTSIAAGADHSVALKQDGTVIAWGLDDYGQTRVPDGLDHVFAVAAGANQTVALRHVTWAPVPSVTDASAWVGVAGDSINVSGASFERVVAVRVAGHITRWTVDSPTSLRLVVPKVAATGQIEVETVSGVARTSRSFVANPEACAPGFARDPSGVCVDIDACVGVSCADHATCIDAPAPDAGTGYACRCDMGYSGDGTTACASCEPVSIPDLLAYYDFEDRLTDQSGHSHDGSATHAPRYVDGIMGRAIRFDGSYKILVRDGALLAPTSTRARTVAFWLDTGATGHGSVIGQYASDPSRDNFEITYYRPRGDMQVAGNGTDSMAHVVGSDFSGWHHWAVAFEGTGGVVRMYMDGALVETGTITMGSGESDLALTIGGLAATGTPLDGVVDEVRIYGRALSAGEISALENVGCIECPPGSTLVNGTCQSSQSDDVCATLSLDGTTLHRATVTGPVPGSAWVGVGTTSVGIQSAGARVDNLSVSDLNGVPLITDGFDNATAWQTQSGAIGSATVTAGQGVVTADWGRFEYNGPGAANSGGLVAGFDVYWSATTNSYDMVVHRSNAALPSWSNAWLRAAIDLGQYASSSNAATASFSLEPRDNLVLLSSSTSMTATPTLGWHSMVLRVEPGACVP